MSILDLNFQVPDPVVVPAGEYQIKLDSVDLQESKSERNPGHPMLKMVFSNVTKPEAVRIYNYMRLPVDTDEAEAKLGRNRQLKWAANALNVQTANVQTQEDLVNAFKAACGNVCWVTLGVEAGPLGDSNSIKKFTQRG